MFIKKGFVFIHCLTMNAECYWHTQKICETSTIYITIRNELAIKLVLQRVACKNVSVLITTCWQLSKLHFSAPKILDF